MQELEVREDPNTLVKELQRLDEVLQHVIQNVFNKWSPIRGEGKRQQIAKKVKHN